MGAERTRGVFALAGVEKTKRVMRLEATSVVHIKAALAEKQYCAVVIDSLHAIAGSDAKRAKYAKWFLRYARESGALVFLICRLSRDGEVKGSVDVGYEADATVYVSKSEVWADKCRWAAESRVSRRK